MAGQLFWYIARATGIVAWALLTASVVWGLLLSTKALGTRPRSNWLLDLHRFLGGCATIFVGVHITALVADSYVHFGPSEVLVPLASAYRPGPVAWGVASLYLLLAVELTSLVRRRLPKRIWRAVHLASFPLFAASTVHTLTAGTESTNRLLWLGVALPALVVLGLAALRLARATGEPPPRPRPVPTTRPGPALGAPSGAGRVPIAHPPLAPPSRPPVASPAPRGATHAAVR